MPLDEKTIKLIKQPITGKQENLQKELLVEKELFRIFSNLTKRGDLDTLEEFVNLELEYRLKTPRDEGLSGCGNWANIF